MKQLSREQIIFSMSRHNPPAAEVGAGERIRFLTEDCYCGHVRTTRDRFPKSLAPTANPATGPVFVRGARPGDVLAVDILEVAPIGPATMLTGPGKGPLGGRLSRDEVVKLPISRGAIVLAGRRVPLNPMIGVIGVAPRGKPLPNTWPGEHGGNLDCNVVRRGAVVFLPVLVPGALLSIGDVHALQAAGEVAICAAECRGSVTVRVRIARRPSVTPSVLYRGALYVLASARALDRAESLVLDKAYRWLTSVKGMSPHDAVRFMSLRCDLEICQVVDPLKTMRMRIPLRVS